MAKAIRDPSAGHDYTINSVDRALDVLAAIMHGGTGPLKAIAHHAGCNEATTLRILHTLQHRGMVKQDQSRGPWRLGAACLGIGRAATQQRVVELAARPAMAMLAKTSREGVYLAVRDGQEAELIAIAPGEKKVRLYGKPGDRTLLYAGPARLLLAHAPVHIQQAALAGKLLRAGPNAPTNPAMIVTDLPRLAGRGWLITEDEIEDGVVTVTVPVRDTGSSVLAILSIISPRLRMPSAQARLLLPQMVEASGALTGAIGILL